MFNIQDCAILSGVAYVIENVLIPELSPAGVMQARSAVMLLQALEQRGEVKDWVLATEIPLIKGLLEDISKSLEAAEEYAYDAELAVLKREISWAVQENWQAAPTQNLEKAAFSLNEILETSITTIAKVQMQSQAPLADKLEEIRRKIRKFLGVQYHLRKNLEYKTQGMKAMSKHE